MTKLAELLKWMIRGMIKTELEAAETRAEYWRDKAMRRGDALNEIILCETPSANGTVLRMVRIAREALNDQDAVI